MITSINKDNSGEYAALFERATATMNGVDGWNVQISDLASYFAYIQDLINKDMAYIMLPLDEPHFFIDANSRKITLPEDFKKNGIAVKGDQTAEVLYFKINRYFDFMDLDTCQIFIQWEQVGAEGGNDSGVSIPLIKDIKSEPDYLIFGWPIDNKITERAGTIKFSVRFVKFAETSDPNEEPELVYSFSTLDATAVINPALDFDDIELSHDETINQMILSRIKNSDPSTSGTAAPAIFILVPDDDYDDKTIIDLNDNGELKLRAQAYSTDGGQIAYRFYRKFNGNTNQISANVEYIKVPDPTLPEANMVYYTYRSATNAYEAMNPVEGTNVYITSGGADVYTRYGYAIATQTGEYNCVAINNRGQGSNSEAISPSIIVPSPATTNIAFSDTQAVIANPTVEIVPVITNENSTDLSYQWYKDGEVIAEALASTYLVPGTADFSADIQGDYKVRVTATKNKESIVSEDEPSILITYPADTFTITHPTSATIGNTISAEVSYTHDYQLEGLNNLSYSWKVINNPNDISTDTDLNIHTKDLLLTDNLNQKMVYCEIKNTYNGSEATNNSRSQYCYVSA